MSKSEMKRQVTLGRDYEAEIESLQAEVERYKEALIKIRHRTGAMDLPSESCLKVFMIANGALNNEVEK